MQLSSTNDLLMGLQVLFCQTPLGLMVLAAIGFRIGMDYLDAKARGARRARRAQSARRRPAPLYKELLPFTVLATGIGLWGTYGAISGSDSPITSILFWALPLAFILWGMVWFSHHHERSRFDQLARTENALDELKSISPSDFEDFVAELFRRKGYRALVVGERGDHGVDIDVKNPQGQRAIVQCKCFTNGWVGENTVRDLYGAFMHDGGATSAFLVTTSFFSDPAKEWAKGKPITLINGPRLVKAWGELNL